MARGRAWRRYKNYTKAKRKRDIDATVYKYGTHWYPWYNNLHQYSKNKIHCSCPICAIKTNNRKANGRYYTPVWNPSMMDLKKSLAMDDDEKEFKRMKYVHFFGSNGYCGTDYNEYECFENNVTEEEIEEYSTEFAYLNAESYEYMVSSDDVDEYYEDALSYCGWEYCSEEEYLKYTNS